MAKILVVNLNSKLYFDFLPNQLLKSPPVSLSSANFNIVVGSCFIIELIADDLWKWRLLCFVLSTYNTDEDKFNYDNFDQNVKRETLELSKHYLYATVRNLLEYEKIPTI